MKSAVLVMQRFLGAYYPVGFSAYGRGQVQSPLSWDLAVVTADSILSPAQSAGSACASEVEAVPSGATVGPNRHWERCRGRKEMEDTVMPLQGKNSSRE